MKFSITKCLNIMLSYYSYMIHNTPFQVSAPRSKSANLTLSLTNDSLPNALVKISDT